jgi:phosphatidylglycerol lysyltransferase
MKVRLACNHVRRLGAAAREAYPLQDARDRQTIAQVEDAWKSARPERQNDSFLRTAPLENATHRRYFVVETARRMESFLVCSPVSRRGQYLQDLVRMPDAPRGANELALLTALRAFQGEGLEFVTGGIVPFYDPAKSRSNEVTGGAGPMGWVVRHFDRLFHFAGIQQFRAKFVPTRVVDIYALLWPGTLTPALAWDIRSLLS